MAGHRELGHLADLACVMSGRITIVAEKASALLAYRRQIARHREASNPIVSPGLEIHFEIFILLA